jgi:hypothetical protein
MIKITIKKIFLTLILFSFSIFNLQSFFITEVKNYKQEETINALTEKEKPKYEVRPNFEEIFYNNGVEILISKKDIIIDASDKKNSREAYLKFPDPWSLKKNKNISYFKDDNDKWTETRLNNWYDFENDFSEINKTYYLESLTFWKIIINRSSINYTYAVPIFWKIKSDDPNPPTDDPNPPTKNPQQYEEKKINKSQWEKFKKDHSQLIIINNNYQEIEKFFTDSKNSKGTLNFKWTETYNSDNSVKEIIIDEVSDKKSNEPIDKPTPPKNPGEEESVKEINVNKNKWEDFKKAHSKLDTTINLYKEIEDFFKKHTNGSLDFEWTAEYENNNATKVTISNVGKKNNNDNNQNLPKEDDSSEKSNLKWIWWLITPILIILIIITVILIKKKKSE